MKPPYPIRIRRKMQKEIQKRIPMYVRSIKVIEERRSDVPLKPRRHKFPSFGFGKIAGSDVRESSTVIRPSVISLSLLFRCHLTISAYRSHRKEYVFRTFSAENTTYSTDLRKKRKKDTEKEKKAPPYTSCGLDWFTSHDYGNLEYYL